MASSIQSSECIGTALLLKLLRIVGMFIRLGTRGALPMAIFSGTEDQIRACK